MTQKITIGIGGQTLEGFDEVSVNRNIENFCGSFFLTAFSEKKIILPFKPSEFCNILVDDELFLTGMIDRIDPGYTETEHNFKIGGRDRTSFIIDNSIEGFLNFTAPINIVEIIEILVADFSIDIAVIPPNEPVEDFQQEELLSADEGEGLFEFIEKSARQRGLLVRTDETGDIILEKEQGLSYNVKLLNEINGTSNNIKSASFPQDYSQRYYRYKGFSQINYSSGIDTNPDYNVTGTYTDNGANVNIDKYLDIESEISNNADSNKKRAEWEAKIRAARSEVYNCTVRDFIAEEINGIKNFWQPNRLVTVKDDFLEVNKTLLIKNVNFNYSKVAGSITNMELVDKNAYILGTSIE